MCIIQLLSVFDTSLLVEVSAMDETLFIYYLYNAEELICGCQCDLIPIICVEVTTNEHNFVRVFNCISWFFP